MSNLGNTLRRAVALVRDALRDPIAAVAVLAPSSVNHGLARRELAIAGPFVRVHFLTPEALVRELGEAALLDRGLLPEPPGWLRASLASLLEDPALAQALGRYRDVLSRRGWKGALEEALLALEHAGVTPEDLRGIDGPRYRIDRALVLAALLGGLRSARAEAGLFGPTELARAAFDAVWDGHDLPANRIAGAVLLGERELAPDVYRVTRAWLAGRAAVRLDLPAIGNLPPAPRGLVLAAPHAQVLPVAPPDGAVGTLAASLFGPLGAPVEGEGIALVRTPDEVRECTEAVRVVQDAVLAGTPLDRIAVVLPDGSQADTLAEALDRAGIPAVWQVGPPLARAPAASFLRLALDVAAGDTTVPTWYELLAQPGLRLPVRTGRGRWRRLLARCGANQGTARILTALRERAEETEDEADQAAHASLIGAMERLHERLSDLDRPRALGGHARVWSAFLRAFWPRSEDAAIVQDLLDGWAAVEGPPLPLASARVELADALAERAWLTGRLTEPAVRVLMPMQTLGGAFDLVCVTSLVQGRLPVDPREHPLLTDDLCAALGADLTTSADRPDLERRRLASVVGACTGRLWLSVPRVEMLTGRPALPSAFVLDVASVVHGRRIRYGDLDDVLDPAGSRNRAYADDPSRALGALEHVVARLKADPRATLPALAAHPHARRLLRAFRAAHRIEWGDADPALAPWRGFVPPDILAAPGLDSEPVSLGYLEALLGEPAEAFLVQVLRARPARRLYPDWNPLESKQRAWRLLAAVHRALAEEGAHLGSDAAAALREDLVDALATAGLDPGLADRVLDLEGSTFRQLDGRDLARGPLIEVESLEVSPFLPWRIEALESRLHAGVIEAVVQSTGPKSLHKQVRVLLEAAARAEVGEAIESVRVVGLDGAEAKGRFDASVPPAVELLRAATTRVRAGWWPFTKGGTFRFAFDPLAPREGG